MNYIDMHCDTLAKAAAQQKKTAGELRNTMVDAKRLHQCGAKAQFFAMFLQQKKVITDVKETDAGYVRSIPKYHGNLFGHYCTGL